MSRVQCKVRGDHLAQRSSRDGVWGGWLVVVVVVTEVGGEEVVTGWEAEVKVEGGVRARARACVCVRQRVPVCVRVFVTVEQ